MDGMKIIEGAILLHGSRLGAIEKHRALVQSRLDYYFLLLGQVEIGVLIRWTQQSPRPPLIGLSRATRRFVHGSADGIVGTKRLLAYRRGGKMERGQ